MKISRCGGLSACLAIWLSGAVGGLPTSASAQGTVGATLEAEIPVASASSTTNLSPVPVPPKFDALRRLEEQLSQAFKRLSPKNDSVNPANELPLRRSPPVINSQPDTRTQDALDRKKNWGFMSLEEMMGVPRREDASGRMDAGGRNQKAKESLIERYYESLGKKGPGSDASLKPADKALGNMDRSKEEESLPPYLRDTQNSLRKLLDSDGNGRIFESTPERASTSDIFGLGHGGMSAANAEISRRAYMNQYRDVLGTTLPGAEIGKSLESFSAGASKPPVSSSAPLGSASRGSGLGQLGAINPVMTPKAPEDVNTRVLNQWNPMYTPPSVQPKPPPVQRPSWEAPRRKF